MLGASRPFVSRLRSSVAAAVLFLAGCYAEELAELRDKVERLQTCQSCAQNQLSQGLALALCSPPVRQLVDEVGAVCKREDVCFDQKINTIVGEADPTHTGRFITMMRQQRHAVLFFSSNDILIGGPQGLYAQRLKRVIYPQPPWLPTTRFLVVSNLRPTMVDAGRLSATDPAVTRAERRGQQVIEAIRDLSFPSTPKVEASQILHWIFAFTRKKDETLLYEETPVPGTELAQSVWVFRIDCATPDAAALEANTCSQCSGGAPLLSSSALQSVPQPPVTPAQAP